MELRVNDYVRTKKRGFQPPQIARIKSMGKDSGYHNQYYIELDHNLIPDYEFHIYEKDIEKSSPNIIDLIEVGDYVNGEKIVGISSITNGPEKGTKTIDYYIAPNTLYYFKNEDIKSIVTKEQFESMEYRIED